MREWVAVFVQVFRNELNHFTGLGCSFLSKNFFRASSQIYTVTTLQACSEDDVLPS
jgi:hypothetical protein